MIYEFLCHDCKKRFEIKSSLADYEKGLTPNCPECKSKKTTQVLGSFFTMSGKGHDDSSCSSNAGDFPGCSSCPMGNSCKS